MVEAHPTQHPGDVLRPVAALTVATALAGAAWWMWRPCLVVVAGESMAPALRPGDRLLVLRSRRPPRPGQVVALRDPRQRRRVLVKRVASVDTGRITVLGDNAGQSTDSRDFGPVQAEALLGRAVYRYAPPDRAGWVAEGPS